MSFVMESKLPPFNHPETHRPAMEDAVLYKNSLSDLFCPCTYAVIALITPQATSDAINKSFDIFLFFAFIVLLTQVQDEQ